MNKNLSFQIDKFELKNFDDSRFAKLEIYVCSTEKNWHNIIFTKESMVSAAKTLVNTPILAKYDASIKDMQGHELDEVGIGGFFNNEEISVYDENGFTYIKAVGYVWKQYNYVIDVLESLRKRNGKASVSMEIGEMSENDKGEIVDFKFFGVTILGEHVAPAIDSARLEVLNFAEIKREYEQNFGINIRPLDTRYKDIDFTIPKNVSSKAKEGLKLYSKIQRGANVNALSIARFLSKESKIDYKKALRIYRYLNSHKKDVFVDTYPYNDEYVSWLCYGGNIGLKWIERIVNEMNKKDKQNGALFEIKIGSGTHYPLALTREKVVDVEWDDSEVRKLCLEDPEYKEIAPKIFLKLEEGWEEGGVDKLKYPVAAVYDGEWKYNKKGIESALAYATKEEDKEVIDKAQNIVDDMLKDENAQKEPAKEEDPAPEPEPKGNEEQKGVEDENPENNKEEKKKYEDMEPEELDKVYQNFKEAIQSKIDILSKFEDISDGEEGYSLQQFKEDIEWVKGMLGETWEFLENDRGILNLIRAEIKELKTYKDNIEENQKQSIVEETLNDPEIAEDLSEEERNELKEEATKNYSFSTIDAWKNLVKVKAYDKFRLKKKEDKEKSDKSNSSYYTRMAGFHKSSKEDETQNTIDKKWAHFK